MERTKSASGYHEILFGQLAKVEEANNSFIFMMSGSDTLFYGVCVAMDELLRVRNYYLTTLITYLQHTSTFITDATPPSLLDTRSRYDFFTTRVYCFISRYPFFRLHFEVLYSILGMHDIVFVTFMKRVRDCGRLPILSA